MGSAALTAGAHYIWKASDDRLVMRVLLSGFASLIMLPFIPFVGWPSATLWPWLMGSIAAHLIYQLAVIQSYNRLDFSLAFPIARGMLPLTAGLLGVLFLGDEIAPLAWIGIALISLGLLALSWSSNGGSSGKLSRSGLLAAGLAGALGAIYSLVDAGGVRAATLAAEFVVWMFVLDPLAIGAVALLRRREKLWPQIQKSWRIGFIGGVLTVLYYSAFLLALDLIAVGTASALRETSIVFAALLAFFGLKETLSLRRWTGIGLGVSGTALIVISTTP